MNNNKSAFTLIELLLVIVVLSVIIGLTIPNFGKSIDSFELKKTSNDIVYLVRWAQSRAINENINYKLVFLNNFTSYRILRGEVVVGSEKEEFSPIAIHMGRSVAVPKSIKLSADKDFLEINHDGSLGKSVIRLRGKDRGLMLSPKIQRGNLLILDDNEQS